ncbi:MAG: polysulfide reductase NrfD [Magnetococcales bacterium]|nr:polysulfide reductase NrfD [Magnetococcales bacterium]MBF0149660.1 polysulfide reductase NrfD [Magnetococcales bacterium]MBF0631803.1 polysulfide reductase NrfD [Magnetococcales bacterium]
MRQTQEEHHSPLLHRTRGQSVGWLSGLWMFFLGGGVVWGLAGYHQQLSHGLAITGLSDQVPWGLYIANFVFLVGIAASAVILVAAVQWFHRSDLSPTLLPAKILAMTAVFMSLLFVLADLGHPERIWHALPLLGSLNFPTSILAWDILVLSAYLLLNMGQVAFHGEKMGRFSRPGAVIAILLGLSIHTVTAFMLAGNPSRPLWYSAILAPRFIVSAFAAGSALMILLFRLINRSSPGAFQAPVFRYLAQVLTTSLWVHLFFLGAELYSHGYPSAEHARAARHLYLGWMEHNPWTLWIYTGLSLTLLATTIMTHSRSRANPRWQGVACLLALVGLWMEKGLGLVIPGLSPTPLGELASYVPTLTEVRIALGIWALGAMVLTGFMMKMAINNNQ